MTEKISDMLKPDGVFFTHGLEDSKITSLIFDHYFYYSALDYKSLVELLDLNNLEIIKETKKYKDLNEERDLKILARNKEQVIK